jgi:hypothetical protein
MRARIRRWLGGRSADTQRLERTLKTLAESQRESQAVLERRLAGLAEQVAQRATAKDSIEIFHALRAVSMALAPHTDAELFKKLDAVAKGSGPIVVGPWTGEVGFEVLYWIPFLEWFRTKWRIDGQRFVIVSRGGVAPWYAIAGASYADVFSVVTPEAFRESTDQDEHKQRGIVPFDQQILDTVTRNLGLEGAACLHPSLVYRTFAPFWRDEAGFGLIERFSAPRRLQPFDVPGAGPLPRDYVAVRFYFNDGFPDTPANRGFARSVIASLSASAPVVLLNPGVEVDDHRDYAPGDTSAIHTLGASLPADQNLAIQSAVISRAKAFVGTYGGYSYLAPLYGVPSVAFYSQRRFKLHHLQVAQRMFERLGTTFVMPIDTADAGLVHSATAGARRLAE